MRAIDADVLVVGGGLVGCSAALHLRQRGANVAVIEKNQLGAAASGVNFGGVRRNGRKLAELPLAARALDLWKRLPELVGNDCEYDVSGHLKVARTDKDMTEMAAHADAQADFGVEVEMLSRNALLDRYPWFGPGAFGAAWCPSDGQANPRLAGPAFARAARTAGAQLFEQDGARHIARESNGFVVETESGQAFRAPTLINSSGAWGGRLAGQFGEPVDLWAMAPQMIVTEPVPYFMEPALGVVGGDVYARQIPRGNIIFGGRSMTADLEVGFGKVDAEESLTTLARTIDIIPRLADVNVIRFWSGVEGCTPDHLPILCTSRTTPGLVHAFGFSGHGFCLGPASGAAAAELALDGRATTPLDGMDIGRFTPDAKEI
jgi:sarcosine oxidase subunit beta